MRAAAAACMHPCMRPVVHARSLHLCVPTAATVPPAMAPMGAEADEAPAEGEEPCPDGEAGGEGGKGEGAAGEAAGTEPA